MLWLGCSGFPATNRSLPSLSAFHAVTGFVLGMADIVPERDLMIDSTELLAWYEREQRDLPWRRPGVTPWQVLVSEFMLQQTPVARVEPIWLAWVARWPTPSATASGKRGRRAAGMGQARLPAAGQAAARMRGRDRRRARRRRAFGRRDPSVAAGNRRIHRACRRMLRLSAAGARRRHERAPRGGEGRTRQGRRGGFVVAT